MIRLFRCCTITRRLVTPPGAHDNQPSRVRTGAMIGRIQLIGFQPATRSRVLHGTFFRHEERPLRKSIGYVRQLVCLGQLFRPSERSKAVKRKAHQGGRYSVRQARFGSRINDCGLRRAKQGPMIEYRAAKGFFSSRQPDTQRGSLSIKVRILVTRCARA